jgi:regulator of protease activity HflC (stomatin/prohibitin superfamily)
MNAIHEKPYWSLNGLAVVAVYPVVPLAGWGLFAAMGPWSLIPVGLISLAALICLNGFYINEPNQVRVILFLGGQYLGTNSQAGFYWTNPLTQHLTTSLRVQNFQTEKLKVNDARGNPIEIAAVVVWRVREPAKATLAVEDYRRFVFIQAETALRSLASHYPYETDEVGAHSLRASPEAVAAKLVDEVQERLAAAGLTIDEARISHLAYAPEIAQAMLRRQQAEAVISARRTLVEGAVGMVELALKRLADGGLVQLDEERKAAMVNNLLVTLVSEQATQPVVNTGTMYG